MFAAPTRCYFVGRDMQKKNHHFYGKQADFGNLHKTNTYLFKCHFNAYLNTMQIQFYDFYANKCICVSLPVLMCWRASLRRSIFSISHWLVLSKYVVAMTVRLMWTMFSSPHPDGWYIRPPIDLPLMSFSSFSAVSVPANIHTSEATDGEQIFILKLR